MAAIITNKIKRSHLEENKLLNIIKKEIKKKNKLQSKLNKQNLIVSNLIVEYNQRYSY